MAEAKPRYLGDYERIDGRRPFREWFDLLVTSDIATSFKISKYLERIRQGNFSNAKLLSGCEGVWELVMNFGPGYRIYFAFSGQTIVLLLLGGSKRTQPKDIEAAVKFWRDFKRRNKGGLK